MSATAPHIPETPAQPPLLCLETATAVCSVAVVQDGQVLAAADVHTPQQQARLLTTLITQTVAAAGLKMADLAGVVCAAGPGSYTGLRIGTSTAKGLCMALDIPLLAVSTLTAWAAAAQPWAQAMGATLHPLMDARRMEVYTATYAPDLRCTTEAHPCIIDEAYVAALNDEPLAPPRIFLGDAAEKCAALLHAPPLRMVWQHTPARAAHMAAPAAQLWAQQAFADVHDFVPIYLKPVRLTTPKPLL